jgi:hypothetical protein
VSTRNPSCPLFPAFRKQVPLSHAERQPTYHLSTHRVETSTAFEQRRRLNVNHHGLGCPVGAAVSGLSGSHFGAHARGPLPGISRARAPRPVRLLRPAVLDALPVERGIRGSPLRAAAVPLVRAAEPRRRPIAHEQASACPCAPRSRATAPARAARDRHIGRGARRPRSGHAARADEGGRRLQAAVQGPEECTNGVPAVMPSTALGRAAGGRHGGALPLCTALFASSVVPLGRESVAIRPLCALAAGSRSRAWRAPRGAVRYIASISRWKYCAESASVTVTHLRTTWRFVAVSAPS